MVEFTATDFQIVLIMTVFLVLVSFLFPVMGFTASDVNSTDIPKFNASQNQFDYLSNPLERPSNPSSGTLEYVEGASQYEDNRQEWIQDDTISITMINQGSTSNPDMLVSLNKFNDSGSFQTSETLTQDEYVLIENYSYSISFENLEFSNSNETITTEWEIHEQPGDEGWVNRIPIVGGIVSGAQQLAGVVAWIGSLLYTVIINAILTVTNVFITLFNILTFIFSFFYWLLSTYAGVTAGAPNDWVSVFMAIPGIILSFEFAKLVILIVNMIIQGLPLT